MTVDFPRFTGTKVVEEPSTIVRGTSMPTSTLPSYLEESQTPIGILLPKTSSDFPVPPSAAASMASNNGDTNASIAEQQQRSEEITNMKLDFDSIAIAAGI